MLRQDLIVSVSTGFCAQLQLEIAKTTNHLVDTERVLLETSSAGESASILHPSESIGLA